MFATALPAAAQQEFPRPSVDGLVAASTATVCAPVHFTGRDWLDAGIFSAGLLAVYAADSQIKAAFQRSRGGTTNSISDVAYKFGQGEYLVPGLAAAYGVAALTDDKKLAGTAILAAESFLVAGGIANVLKFTFHQARPNSADTNAVWHGASLSNYDLSFPSGHAAVSFAVAGVFAKRYPDGAVPVVAYTAAGLCGLSRINDNAHWASDVVLGSAIGIFTAWHVAATQPVTVMPLYERNGGGLQVSGKF